MDYFGEHVLETGTGVMVADSNDDDDGEEDDEGEEEEDEDDEDEVDGPNDDGNSWRSLYGAHVPRPTLRSSHQDIDSNSVANSSVFQGHVVVDSQSTDHGESRSQRRVNTASQGGGGVSLKDDIDGKNGEEFSGGDVDGLFCPICYEAWSSGGDHHVCCLPCGHIYGLSCIKKWLRRRGSSKCPQCKKKCGMKDICLLYASRIVAVDEELQKKVHYLEAKCASLEKKRDDWYTKDVEWKKKEADLHKQIKSLKERTLQLERLLDAGKPCRTSGSLALDWNCRGKSAFGLDAGCSNKFTMQKDFHVDGARLFDIDASSQTLVVARRLPGYGGAHVLTKVSLLSEHEKDDIQLPVNSKAVKDLEVSPHARLVLLASLGKKLSVLSTVSNNTVVTYDLPAAAWSCSWDICSSHYVYAGLQNGMVLQFDTRNTMRHVQCLVGLRPNPIHTLYSLSPSSSVSSGIRSVLTASSVGLCQWDFGGGEEKPCLIPESGNEGICISLSYSKFSGYVVASYRPKIEIPGSIESSQLAPTASGQGTRGCHVLYQKKGYVYQKLGATCANVNDVRLPKSAIIHGVYQNPAFASVDELAHELVLQELPSLMGLGHLKPQKAPIRDVKFNHLLNSGIFGCLCDDSVQLFTAKSVTKELLLRNECFEDETVNAAT